MFRCSEHNGAFLLFASPPTICSRPQHVCMLIDTTVPYNQQVDWAEEQASRTDEFQKELQAKTEAMSDLNAEKVR